MWRLWNTVNDRIFEIILNSALMKNPVRQRYEFNLLSVQKSVVTDKLSTVFSLETKAPSTIFNAVVASVVAQSHEWEPSIQKEMIWMILHTQPHPASIASVFLVYYQRGTFPNNFFSLTSSISDMIRAKPGLQRCQNDRLSSMMQSKTNELNFPTTLALNFVRLRMPLRPLPVLNC